MSRKNRNERFSERHFHFLSSDFAIIFPLPATRRTSSSPSRPSWAPTTSSGSQCGAGSSASTLVTSSLRRITVSDETPHRFLRYSYGEEELFCFLFDSRHIIILLQPARTLQECEVRWGKTCKNRREVTDGKSDRNLLITPSELRTEQSLSWWTWNLGTQGSQQF